MKWVAREAMSDWGFKPILISTCLFKNGEYEAGLTLFFASHYNRNIFLVFVYSTVRSTMIRIFNPNS